MDDEPLTLLYIPCGSEEEAERIAGSLLSEQLIACANIFGSRSLYRWQGETEAVLICKTLSSRARAARKVALRLHSYELPCVLTFSPVDSNYGFLAWVRAEVTGASGSSKPGAETATAREP